MVLGITYGDEQYTTSIKLNKWSLKTFGRVDVIQDFKRSDIDRDFYEANRKVLDCKRGGGYWLWKPYFILKALNSVNEGDYVLFIDAGAIVIKSIKKLIRIMERDSQPIFLSSSLLQNGDWCKKQTLIAMGCDCDAAKKRPQPEGGFVLLKKCNKSYEFVNEWLKYAKNFDLISDCSEKESRDQYPSFHEHRHDQAIMSNVSYKMGIEPYKGVGRRSEYCYYVRFGNDFFGYTREDLIKLYLTERNRDFFKNSNYGRIVINTRIDTNEKGKFLYLLVRKLSEALLCDTYGVLMSKYYVSKFLRKNKKLNAK